MLLTLCLGCADQSPQQKPQPTKTDVQIEVDPLLAQQVKALCREVTGVQNSTAVVVNKEISVAIEVTGFDRLRLKAIRQQAHQKISNQYQQYTVYLTSDKKLFKSLQDIEKQLTAGDSLSLPQLQQRVAKINKDMRG
ncbi:YhcN/YlaJ family sporulation lipoprotein [Peptococcaceae bacterium 1198_IL3148]